MTSLLLQPLIGFVLLWQAPAVAVAPDGKKLFEGQCAVCHGMDGRGSSGPSLARPKLPRAADDAALRRVIADGIPNTNMPGSWQMSEREVAATAAYVRTLGKVKEEPVPGDGKKGREVYAKAGCASCHIVQGKGNGYGPELTEIGLKRSVSHLKQSVVNPAADVPGEWMSVLAITAQGSTVTGVRVNEDTFTIQVREMSGRVHSFTKVELKSLEKQRGVSLMPGYGQQLSAAEVDDLVAYLVTLRGETE